MIHSKLMSPALSKTSCKFNKITQSLPSTLSRPGTLERSSLTLSFSVIIERRGFVLNATNSYRKVVICLDIAVNLLSLSLETPRQLLKWPLIASTYFLLNS
jgi:hypothetical protein